MGMVDTLVCERNIPDLPKEARFTTKDLFRYGGYLAITAGGRLMEELAYRVPESRRDLDYHGDILAYGFDQHKQPLEYVARFTYGQLEWFRPASELPEAHVEMLRSRS